MDRRKFITALGAGSAAAFFGLNSRPLWAQTGHQPPIDCSPPPAGAATHITFNTTLNVAPRKSIWDLSTTEVTRLQSAYQALRDLTTTTPGDPRGWMQQANTHCFNCSGGYNGVGDEIHGGWWFFPWHRCYLHIHERILGSLIGDPTFRLAYWDWDTYPSHGIFPPTFTQNSLVDQYRGTQPGDVIPSDLTGPVAINSVMTTTGTAAFLGGDPAQGLAGAMESSPHGPVHIWNGYSDTGQPLPPGCFYPNNAGGTPVDQSGNGCLDMGVLATAAQDPVFFSHHGNIDRLWDVWASDPASDGNYTDTGWLDHQFNFYDENGNWVYITPRDVVGTNEQANLRYAYQPPQSAVPALSAARSTAAKKATKFKPVPALIVSSGVAATTVGTKPHVRTVALPSAHKSNLKLLAAGGPRKLELHIDGLKLPPNESVIMKVFVGDPKAGRATPLGPSYVGTFSVVISGSSHKHPTVRHAVFELRPETAALLAKQKNLTVTLVPTRVSGKEPLASNLTYERIYLSQR